MAINRLERDQKRFWTGIFIVLGLTVLLADRAVLAESPVVRSLDVVTDELTSAEDVKARMSTKIGLPFSEDSLEEDVRRLFGLGYVCTGIEKNGTQNEIDLVIHISSQPVISAVSFEGNTRIRDKELEEKMEISPGYPAQMYRIRKEMARLQDLYREKGFHYVHIEAAPKAENGRVELVFRISEGPRIKISDMNVDGNLSVKMKTVRKLIKARKHIWWRPNYYVNSKVEQDADNLARYYRSKGWLDAGVEIVRSFNEDSSRVDITFRVSEGPRYSSGKVSISGNQLFDSETLMKEVKLAESDPFDITVLGRDIRNVRNYYASRGYMLTQVIPVQQPRQNEPVVDIDLQVKESRKVRIERIDIKGNDKTRDEVIRRELDFFPGETFDINKIDNSKRSVNNTGLFSSVDIRYQEGSSPDLAQVDVDVSEQKTGQLMFGAGYSSEDRVTGFLNLTQKNFDVRRWPSGPENRFGTGKAFVGDGQTLRLNIKTGSENTEYGIDFMEPWIFNRPIGWGFGFYSRDAYFSEYNVYRVGGYTSLSRRIRRNAIVALKYRRETAELDDVDTTIAPVIGDESGKNLLSGIELSGTIDGLDNKYFPTHGYRLRLGHEYVTEDLGSELDFTKSNVEFSWYNKLFETRGGKVHVLALTTGVDWAQELSGTSNVPIYERYYAGGIKTVRGYERRTLGPRYNDESIGGDFRLVVNVEYVFPAYEDIVYGILFYDAGEVWEDEEEFDTADLRRSVGIGVRFKTPVFPVELYYGWALDELPDEPSGRFHFAFGYMF